MAQHANRLKPGKLAQVALSTPPYVVGPDWEPPCTARPQAQDRQLDELNAAQDADAALSRLKYADLGLPLDLVLREPWHGRRRVR